MVKPIENLMQNKWQTMKALQQSGFRKNFAFAKKN